MQRVTTLTAALLAAACLGSSAANAQLDLSSIKMAEPSPELPGDRAMSCAKIAEEMGEIMSRRGVKQKVASSRSKLCSSRKEFDRLGEERKKLSATQNPALVTAAMTGGPAADIVTRKTQAEDAALEAKQRPDRDRAVAGVGSSIGDIMSVMNDPRLVRLNMLGQEKRCAESMAPSQKSAARPEGDVCDGVVDESAAAAGRTVTSPAAASDPFAARGKPAATPAASDPFAKR